MENIVNGHIYKEIGLLGHGKGGYTYLCLREDGVKVCLKKIHHEPCPYYSFGNKIESELKDYKTLVEVGIKMPGLLDFDKKQEIIVKEYIEGETIDHQIKDGSIDKEAITQVVLMADLLKRHNLNIDYYPTNFIFRNGVLYYIDYECNEYHEEWSYEKWGSTYWSRSEAFLKAFGE